MILFQIKETNKFMQLLLTTAFFDRFSLEEAVIRTCVTHTIDGRYHPEFFGEEASPEASAPYVPWEGVRPVCLSLIRGRHTPLQNLFYI